MILNSPLAAQESALAVAERLDACAGNGSIVSASYLPDGRVQVQCSGPSSTEDATTSTESATLAGGTAGVTVGLITLFLTALAVGGGGSSTSDTQ